MIVFNKTRILYGVHVTTNASRMADSVLAAFFSCFFSWFFFFFFRGWATGRTDEEDRVPVEPFVVKGFGIIRAFNGGTADEGLRAMEPDPEAGESKAFPASPAGAEPANFTFWCWPGRGGGGKGPGSWIILMEPFWSLSISPGMRIRIVYTDSLAGNFPFEPVHTHTNE
jgi:hypothetical protein